MILNYNYMFTCQVLPENKVKEKKPTIPITSSIKLKNKIKIMSSEKKIQWLLTKIILFFITITIVLLFILIFTNTIYQNKTIEHFKFLDTLLGEKHNPTSINNGVARNYCLTREELIKFQLFNYQFVE